MKDYTNYNFAAIVGAEVRIDFKNIYLAGKLVADGQYSLCIQTSDGAVTSIGKKNIPNLTAKIKVEDMSVKQLKHFAKIQVEPSGIFDVVIRFKEKRIEIFAGWDKKRCVHLFSEQHSLDDYIDCTDWGWKHE